jgi:hypothetical protein
MHNQQQATKEFGNMNQVLPLPTNSAVNISSKNVSDHKHSRRRFVRAQKKYLLLIGSEAAGFSIRGRKLEN